MALPNEELSREQLLHAQAHVWSHIYAFIKSNSLKSAVQLGIPDIIHNHGKPIKLSELVDALPIHKAKSHYIYRLMRVLVHFEFFMKVDIPYDEEKQEEEEEHYYWLTPASRVLLLDDARLITIAPIMLLVLDSISTKPWEYTSEWLANEHHASPFETAHGKTYWEVMGEDPRMRNLFNEAMSSDTRLVASVLASDCKHVFDGIESVVDVGGNTGTLAKAILDEFPNMKCIVLDLPHNLVGLEGSKNLTYVGGDMFEAIPPADAILLKWILHNWNDEDCVKILKKCKHAISDKVTGRGKVIIIDMVMNIYEGDKNTMENQLLFDMLMMTLYNTFLVCISTKKSISFVIFISFLTCGDVIRTLFKCGIIRLDLDMYS